jgi:carboxymethylenebutenolidase
MTEVNPRQNVTFASNGGWAHGYLKQPARSSGPGLIVIQEWWGLDDHMADVVDRFAAEGFVALAPDLYGGRVAHDVDSAGKMLEELPVEQAAKDLAGAVDFLLAEPSVTSSTLGVVGFCMGGGFVLQLAAQQSDRIGAAVPFYGVGPAVPHQYRTVTAPIQGHYGEQDAFYPVEEARTQEQQIRDESRGSVEFFYYPAGHAFHNDKDQLGTYDEQYAKLAWERAVAFLKANVH